MALPAWPIAIGSATKKEGRPSGWKDGLTRSFVHCSTHRL
ncbi:hypothetical protein SynBIOSU31_01692 [Synechococcus sp. BIOS-U3-1]|nr:hypothetical protein SynBIOSU31_01692 [Synechococcus sp. BIOS-U3-1]